MAVDAKLQTHSAMIQTNELCQQSPQFGRLDMAERKAPLLMLVIKTIYGTCWRLI